MLAKFHQIRLQFFEKPGVSLVEMSACAPLDLLGTSETFDSAGGFVTFYIERVDFDHNFSHVGVAGSLLAHRDLQLALSVPVGPTHIHQFWV